MTNDAIFSRIAEITEQLLKIARKGNLKEFAEFYPVFYNECSNSFAEIRRNEGKTRDGVVLLRD